MSTYNISCTIGTTDPTSKLGIEVWVDNQLMFNADHITDTHPLSFDINEDEAEHELRFVMKNKTVNDTIIDDSGNIIKDATITIDNLAFEEIPLNQIIVNHAVYTHNFNGTQPEIKDQFYGAMGCNGTVSLKFTTPIYLWLLENM